MGIFKKVIDGDNDILNDLKHFRIYLEVPKEPLPCWCKLLWPWQWFATLHFITSQKTVHKCPQCVWQRIFWSWAVTFWHSRTIYSQLGCNVTPDTFTNRCLGSNFSSLLCMWSGVVFCLFFFRIDWIWLKASVGLVSRVPSRNRVLCCTCYPLTSQTAYRRQSHIELSIYSRKSQILPGEGRYKGLPGFRWDFSRKSSDGFQRGKPNMSLWQRSINVCRRRYWGLQCLIYHSSATVLFRKQTAHTFMHS